MTTKTFIFLFLCICFKSSFSQTLDDRIHSVSTITKIYEAGRSLEGTGFFYGTFNKEQFINRNPRWLKFDDFWLVTNRHNVLSKNALGRERIPETFTFYLRKAADSTTLNWIPITISSW